MGKKKTYSEGVVNGVCGFLVMIFFIALMCLILFGLIDNHNIKIQKGIDVCGEESNIFEIDKEKTCVSSNMSSIKNICSVKYKVVCYDGVFK